MATIRQGRSLLAGRGTVTGTVADTVAPSVPTGLTAQAVSTTQVNLTWNASTDASGIVQSGVASYKVRRGGVVVQTVAHPTVAWNNTGLTAGTAYSYTVSAVDVYGNESAQSSPVAVSTPSGDVTAPTWPSSPVITFTNVSAYAITINWIAAFDAVGVASYRLERARSADFVTGYTLLANATTARTYSDSGLTPSTAYWYRVSAVDAAGNRSAYSSETVDTQSAGANTPVPAVYPLELVSPRAVGTYPSADAGTPAMPAGHRIFSAYPGIEYNIRAHVVGGSYPFTFSLSNAPSGMVFADTGTTSGSRTGEIRWPNPQVNATPTITVTDGDGTVASSSWAITVTTSGFKFVNASASSTGSGTINSPWQTLLDVYNLAAPSDIVYFRAGTYTPAGIGVSSSGEFQRNEWNSLRCQRWIAYPGESVTYDAGYTGANPGTVPRFWGNSTYSQYIDGITFRNQLGKCIIQIVSNYVTFRRLILRDIINGTDGNNPAAIMYWSESGTSAGWYGLMQDCEATALNGGGAFKTYSQYKWLCEDLYCHDSTSGPDIKAYTGRWEVRGSTFVRMSAAYGGLFGNMNQDPAAGLRNNGEFRYNLTIMNNSSQLAFECNQDGNSDQIDIYRNTFVDGIVRVRNCDSSDGPFKFYNNVIVNENSGTDRITLENVTDPSRITYASNLTGSASAGIVNANGLLQGEYTQYLGTRGHEIP